MSFQVNCGTCKGVIMLLKDSTEGQKVFHGGDCYNNRKDTDMKHETLEVKILPLSERLESRSEFPCESCGYVIQKKGTYYRVTEDNGINPKCVCFRCAEVKGS